MQTKERQNYILALLKAQEQFATNSEPFKILFELEAELTANSITVKEQGLNNRNVDSKVSKECE